VSSSINRYKQCQKWFRDTKAISLILKDKPYIRLLPKSRMRKVNKNIEVTIYPIFTNGVQQTWLLMAFGFSSVL
jgi:hypothetical protein